MQKRTRIILAALALAGFFWVFALPQGVQAQAAITEVTMLQTGRLFNYEVILRRDGAATFIGSRGVGKIGTYTADIGGFDHLSRAIRQRHFQHFKAKYTNSATDLPDIVTTVISGGHRKTVDNYGDIGPQALWEIETLIDGVVAQAQWKKVSNNTDFR